MLLSVGMFLLAFIFTIFVELIAILVLKKYILIKKTDLNSLLLTIIAINFMTHPIAYAVYDSFVYISNGGSVPWLTNLLDSFGILLPCPTERHLIPLTARMDEIPCSEVLLSWVYGIIEIFVILIESLLIHWAMRYTLIRSFMIGSYIQFASILVSMFGEMALLVLGFLAIFRALFDKIIRKGKS